MTAIKIDPKNADKIKELLRSANGRATSFAITLFKEVQKFSEQAEERLAMLPKAERKGAIACATPAGPSSSAYKYAAASTAIGLERRATGWFLTSAAKIEVYPKEPQRINITITREQADEIQRRALTGFTVALVTEDA